MQRDHAMVGDDDKIDRQMQRCKFRLKVADHRIDVVNGRPHLFSVRAIGVAGMVDVGIVKGDEVGAKLWRQLQPRYDLVHTFFIIQLVLELQIIRGAFAVNLGLGTGPEETGRSHALLLCQYPERRAAIQTAIGVGLRLCCSYRSGRAQDRQKLLATMPWCSG